MNARDLMLELTGADVTVWPAGRLHDYGRRGRISRWITDDRGNPAGLELVSDDSPTTTGTTPTARFYPWSAIEHIERKAPAPQPSTPCDLPSPHRPHGTCSGWRTIDPPAPPRRMIVDNPQA